MRFARPPPGDRRRPEIATLHFRCSGCRQEAAAAGDGAAVRPGTRAAATGPQTPACRQTPSPPGASLRPGTPLHSIRTPSRGVDSRVHAQPVRARRVPSLHGSADRRQTCEAGRPRSTASRSRRRAYQCRQRRTLRSHHGETGKAATRQRVRARQEQAFGLMGVSEWNTLWCS